MSSAAVDTEDPKFRARRVQNWVFLGLMYSMFYMGRYNFSAVNALLAEKFGWTNTDLGNIIAAGKIVYGLSVFLNGPLADKIGGKKAILLGAAGASVFNLLFGFGSFFLVKDAVWADKVVVTPAELAGGLSMTTVISLFSVVWAANHYFQSFGALSIVKINAAWFKVSERGSFAGIFGIMIQSGRTLAFSVGPLIAGALPWQWVFWVPAVSLAVLLGLNYFLVENSPEDAGLGDLDTGDETAEEKASAGGLAFVLKKVFASSTMWTIAFASMMIGFVRNGVDDWFAKYFANVHHAQVMQKSAMIPYNVGALVASILFILGILKLKQRIDQRQDLSKLVRFFASFSIVFVVFIAVAIGMKFLLASGDPKLMPSICFALAAVGMPIAAVFGGLVSGNMSDAIFGHRRAPVIFIAFCGMAVTTGLFAIVDNSAKLAETVPFLAVFEGGPYFAAWVLIALSFFIQSAHSLVGGAASMDFGGRKAVATAAGLFDGAQYVAGAVVAQALGRLLDRFGWGAWGLTQLPFAIIGAILIARLWNARPGSSGHL